MLEELVPLVGIEPVWSERQGRVKKIATNNQKELTKLLSYVAKAWNLLPKNTEI